MSRLLLIAVAVLTLAFAPAPLPRRASSRTDDNQRIQGVWVLTEVGGQARTGNDLDRWVFGTGKLEIRICGRSYPYHWRYAIDPRAAPRALDVRYSPDGGEGYGLKGVYSLARDTLVITYTAAVNERPKRIDQKDEKTVTLRFRREGR